MKPSKTPAALLVPLALWLTLGLGGCVPRVRFRAEVPPTSLVAVSSGVWVVYDYPEAVFYSDGAYWWWNAGSWYRSGYADSGWVYVQTGFVPARVRGIDRPEVYVRYRATGTRRAVPAEHVTGHYDSPGRGRGPDGDRGRGPEDEPGERGRGPEDERGERGRGPGDDDRGARGRGPADDRDDGRAHDDGRRGEPPTPAVRVPDPAEPDPRGRGRGGDPEPDHGGDADHGRGHDEHGHGEDAPRATPSAPPPATPAPEPRRDRRVDPPSGGHGGGGGGEHGGRGGRGRGSDDDDDGPH